MESSVAGLSPQTDRQTDRHKDRHKDRQTDRQTYVRTHIQDMQLVPWVKLLELSSQVLVK